jgi:nitric oxide reductase large subunit
MDIASNLFTAAFLILVAASAAVTGSMILLGLIDRIFRKKPPAPIATVSEEEEVLEEWTEDLWSKDAAHADRI